MPSTSKAFDNAPQSPLNSPRLNRDPAYLFEKSDSIRKRKKKTAVKKMIDLRLDMSEFSGRESEDAQKAAATPQPRTSRFVIKRREASNNQTARKTLIQSISKNKLPLSFITESKVKTDTVRSSKQLLNSYSIKKGLASPAVKILSTSKDASSTTSVYKLAALATSKQKASGKPSVK